MADTQISNNLDANQVMRKVNELERGMDTFFAYAQKDKNFTSEQKQKNLQFNQSITQLNISYDDLYNKYMEQVKINDAQQQSINQLNASNHNLENQYNNLYAMCQSHNHSAADTTYTHESHNWYNSYVVQDAIIVGVLTLAVAALWHVNHE